jgi:mRNA interferase MazF
LAITSADRYGDFIALPVTSHPQHEHALPLTQPDLNLPAPSWIRTDRIVTLNASLVLKVIGIVSDEIARAAVERFCVYVQHR